MIDMYDKWYKDSYLPIIEPNLITGEGRMKGRGWPRGKSISHKKWKNVRNTAKKSRRKNRR